MSAPGYAISWRKKWEHPVFRNKQEAAVWAWMCDVAQWQDYRLPTKFGPVNLKRGELLIAERALADDFGMHRNTLRTLLQRMVDDGMIEFRKDRCPHRAGTVVGLINYEQYQSIKLDDQIAGDRKRTEAPAESHTEEGPKEDRRETKNNTDNTHNTDNFSLASSVATLPTVVGCADASVQDKVVSKTTDLFGNAITDEPLDTIDESDGEVPRTTLDMVRDRGYKTKAVWLSEQFDLFWTEFPKRAGSSSKDKAVGAFIKAVKASINPERIIYGATCFRKNCIADGIAVEDGKRISRAVPMASSWLKLEDRNWEAAIEDYEDRLKNPVPVKPNNVTHVAFNSKPQQPHRPPAPAALRG